MSASCFLRMVSEPHDVPASTATCTAFRSALLVNVHPVHCVPSCPRWAPTCAPATHTCGQRATAARSLIHTQASAVAAYTRAAVPAPERRPTGSRCGCGRRWGHDGHRRQRV